MVENTKKEDSLSLQRRKAQIAVRNSKIITEGKKQRLGAAKIVKVTK